MAQHVSPTDVRFSSPNAARIARLAELLDWSLTWASNAKRALKMRSPVDDKTILLPVTTSLNANRARATMNQIFTHTDQDRQYKLFTEGIPGDISKDPELAEIALELGLINRHVDEEIKERAIKAADKVADDIVEKLVGTLVSEVRITTTSDGKPMKGHWYAVATKQGTYYECRDHDPPVRVETVAGIGGHNRMMHGDPEEIAATQAKAHASNAKKMAERKARTTEVSRVPWTAKRGHGPGNTGRVYEHSWVDEITYADGTVEYECNICHRYTSDTGRSVAHHVGQAHKDRQAPAPPETHLVTDYPPPAWSRKGKRNAKLRNEVLTALDSIKNWQSLSKEELAVQIEERIMDARPERQPAEPLTDSEILSRIGMLMDRGQFDHLRHEVQDLTALVATLTTERNAAVIRADEAEREADRRRANLRALQEMIDEAAAEEAKAQ